MGAGKGNPPRIPACGSPLDPVGDVHPGTRPVTFQVGWTNVGSHWPLATLRATDRQSRPKAMPPRFRSLARPIGKPARTGSRSGAKAHRTPHPSANEAPMTVFNRPSALLSFPWSLWPPTRRWVQPFLLLQTPMVTRFRSVRRPLRPQRPLGLRPLRQPPPAPAPDLAPQRHLLQSLRWR